MNRPRTHLALLAAGLLGLATSLAARPSFADPSIVAPSPADPSPAAPSPSEGKGRVVILGFDGADARTVKELMQKDPARYPTMSKLAESGTFAPLEVVVPAESPVSWASINSGQNPGKTGVPGFIRRNISGNYVAAGFGHIEKKDGSKGVPLEELAGRDNAPIPLWSPGATAAVAGGAVFLAVLVVALLVFRRLAVAAVLALVLGGGAAFAGMQVRALLPKIYSRTSNVNQVESFWDAAARAGVPCVVLDAQQAFDGPNTPGAKVLYGLGLPDSRNDLGQWFIYTTDPAQLKREGKPSSTAGTVYRVDEDGGVIRAKLPGPRNFYEQQRLQAEYDAETDSTRKEQLKDRLDWASGSGKYLKDYSAGRVLLDIEVALEPDGARVKLGGEEQRLVAGQWSDYYDLNFEINWLVKIHAITRVKLVRLQPYFELLVNTLDIDPRDPPFWQPISSPHGFSAELASECGLYETYGWPTLTMPFKDEKIEPETLLEDVEFTERWREMLTHQVLGKDDWRCFMSVFSTTDRVQHMTYQFYDQGHPLYRPEVATRETTFFGERIQLAQAIPSIYHQMDRIIGDVLAKLRPEDTLFVISDHGFQTFRRQVHVNNWLAENGYLALTPDLKKDNSLQFVDWSKTRAYALGLGFIYVNLEGREPQGIVKRDDARALMEEIRAKLLAARDPDGGAPICSEVYFPRDLHSGSFVGLEADIVPGFKPPYRVGWSTSGGGLETVEENGAMKPTPVCTNNDSNWSGDHVSMSLSEVKGVFFSNKKVAIPPEGVRSMQIAPTALTLLGVSVPKEMDLPALELK